MDEVRIWNDDLTGQQRADAFSGTSFNTDEQVNSANIPTLDHSVIASKGYMLAYNDWRNFEMTQYVKVNTPPSDNNFSPYGSLPSKDMSFSRE